MPFQDRFCTCYKDCYGFLLITVLPSLLILGLIEFGLHIAVAARAFPNYIAIGCIEIFQALLSLGAFGALMDVCCLSKMRNSENSKSALSGLI